MKFLDFQKIPLIEDFSKAKVEEGDMFLMGLKVGAQRENKEVGDMITYYEVLSVNPRTGNVSYAPRYARLTN